MKIQITRSSTNFYFNVAFQKVASYMLRNSSINNEEYNISIFNVSEEALKFIILLCALRYIIRSLHYPKIFSEEEQDYRRVISYLSKVYQHE